MSRDYGQWLRHERQERGWNVPEMRHRLREAAKLAGDTLPSNNCLSVMIHRWENDRSGISERYRLHYCHAFQIPVDQFGQTASPHLTAMADAAHASPAAAGPQPVQAQPSACNPATLQSDSVYLAYLAIDLQPAIRAACADVLRDILTDIIRHLSHHLPNDDDGTPRAKP